MTKQKHRSGGNYTRKVDRKLKYFGEIDFDKNVIKVNPKKGDLVNTIIHEEIHRKNPKMKGKNIVKKT